MRIKIEATYEEEMEKYIPFLEDRFTLITKDETERIFGENKQVTNYYIQIDRIARMLEMINGLYKVDGTNEIVIRRKKEWQGVYNEYGYLKKSYWVPTNELVLEIYNGYRE